MAMEKSPVCEKTLCEIELRGWGCLCLELKLEDVYGGGTYMCCCFCSSLGPAVCVRMCPGRCIEVFLCIVSVLLVIETHCVSCHKKMLSVVCPKHLSVLVVARIGKLNPSVCGAVVVSC